MSAFDVCAGNIISALGVEATLSGDGISVTIGGVLEKKQIGRDRNCGRAEILSDVPVLTIRDIVSDYRRVTVDVDSKKYIVTKEVRDGYGLVLLYLRECQDESEES